MATPDRGKKHTCQSCGVLFYDLKRTPIVCPKCGAEVEVQSLLKPRRPGAQTQAPKPVAVPAPSDDDDEELDVEVEEDEDDELIEDMSDMGDDDDDMSEVKEHMAGGEEDKE
ncbi:MAG: TIGR02300 family protein [Rhodospirillaceae bacterium]